MVKIYFPENHNLSINQKTELENYNSIYLSNHQEDRNIIDDLRLNKKITYSLNNSLLFERNLSNLDEKGFPSSVILLDEIEKAHPDVFNILLQVLDDGRLTDSQGRTVDFSNTVIVMTSNIGSDKIQSMQASDYDSIKNTVMGDLKNYFRPEFINRIDDVIVFNPLNKNDIVHIAKIQINKLIERVNKMHIELIISNNVFDLLANVGYDPIYGARPLKRAIQHYLENPLSKFILSGKITNKIINISLLNNEISIS